MTIDVTIEVWRERNQYVARAVPIDVISSGPTVESARAAVDEAIRCYIKTAQDAGTLDQILDECGYERRAGHWCSPDWIGVECRAIAV
jgi:predicted RNase H-like HicB family nuclease